MQLKGVESRQEAAAIGRNIWSEGSFGEISFPKSQLQNSLDIDVYVVPIALTAASQTLADLRAAAPACFDSLDLQHLRRLVRPEHLPAHVRRAGPGEAVSGSSEAAAAGSSSTDIYLLVGPVSSISLPALSQLLPCLRSASITTIKVPLLAPTSAAAAQLASQAYWPTVFKNHNPFGPHPSLLARAETDMLPHLDHWLATAQRAARESAERGIGEACGAVVLERNAIAAVAGDARWAASASTAASPKTTPNALAHPALRAIALIAHKRLSAPHPPATPPQSAFQDLPLTPLEAEYHSVPIAPGGYLCVGLDMVLTHEPCVMCAMALLHARFGRVVFGRRMPRTGGAVAATSNALGHGIFWREELSWRLLAWEVEGGEAGGLEVGQDVHV
ncbi:MAG: tRNA-specific adenosine deaminase subunit tad3 [Trizodia sp. TS-e1964]|nr:MAG: tRNA-specific adenosine deaminase subunit tad3 [Trizodia sp. TS-e1964]